MMLFSVYYRMNNDFRRTNYSDGDTVDKTDYEFITEVEAVDIDDVYEKMNVVHGDELPVTLRVRSMSVNDIAVDENYNVFICCSFGWKNIKFS